MPWLITWDPAEAEATRPLAIQKDGTWYCYGLDITKNVWEIFGSSGYIRTAYDYTPYGGVTEKGDVTQPIQWSSEMYDAELALVYYNYRCYNPMDGRWISRDLIAEGGGYNLYAFIRNYLGHEFDVLGLDHKQNGINAFSQLENKLKALCTNKCCKEDQIDACKNKAKDIAESIKKTWEDQFGKGKNTSTDNVGGYLCWDWATAFDNIGKTVGNPNWSSNRIRIRKVKNNPSRTPQPPVHFFTRFCACNCNKEECCIDVDDGWFDDDFIHTSSNWYANNLNDVTSEYDWIFDSQEQGVPPGRLQPIPISIPKCNA